MSSHAPFILVHGASHGGWCWAEVAERLCSAGHVTHCPTLPGLAERADLLSTEITLDVMIEDVAAFIDALDMPTAILVGHSFAGAVITGLADRMPERFERLVFLDAFVLKDGDRAIDLVPPEVAADRMIAAAEFSGGISLPVPPPAAFGIEDADLAARVAPKLTPHPLASYLSPLYLLAPAGNGLPVDYVTCTAPPYATMATSMERAREHGWPVHELNGPHDAMLTHPDATAELLLHLAAQ